MKGIPVNFQSPTETKLHAFRRLTVLPRVGEIVTFNSKNYMVMQIMHNFKLHEDEQEVFIAIGEV